MLNKTMQALESIETSRSDALNRVQIISRVNEIGKIWHVAAAVWYI
jgi:hypothetical protein